MYFKKITKIIFWDDDRSGIKGSWVEGYQKNKKMILFIFGQPNKIK